MNHSLAQSGSSSRFFPQSPQSPTQIDVYVVTETITDGLQTPEPVKVCQLALNAFTIQILFGNRSGIQTHI